MEKLKVKHDHSLTDILKVLIFAIVLLIPGFMFLPSMLYFGMNEQANAPTKEVNIKQNVEIYFNQLIQNNNIDGTFTTNGVQWGVYQTQNVNLVYGHQYVTRIDIKASEAYNMWFRLGLSSRVQYVMQLNNLNTEYQRFTYLAELVYGDTTATNNQAYFMAPTNANGITITYQNLNLFDLTQMFGEGNEPTLNEFNNLFIEESYEYTLNKKEVIYDETIGTETVVDITTQLEYNWEQIWQKPLLSWTNRSILKNGLDNFTSVFGIDNNSYITNLLTYELIMVGVYIVIDIVLTLFKWLTHMIGNK